MICFSSNQSISTLKSGSLSLFLCLAVYVAVILPRYHPVLQCIMIKESTRRLHMRGVLMRGLFPTGIKSSKQPAVFASLCRPASSDPAWRLPPTLSLTPSSVLCGLSLSCFASSSSTSSISSSISSSPSSSLSSSTFPIHSSSSTSSKTSAERLSSSSLTVASCTARAMSLQLRRGRSRPCPCPTA